MITDIYLLILILFILSLIFTTYFSSRLHYLLRSLFIITLRHCLFLPPEASLPYRSFIIISAYIVSLRHVFMPYCHITISIRLRFALELSHHFIFHFLFFFHAITFTPFHYTPLFFSLMLFHFSWHYFDDCCRFTSPWLACWLRLLWDFAAISARLPRFPAFLFASSLRLIQPPSTRLSTRLMPPAYDAYLLRRHTPRLAFTPAFHAAADRMLRLFWCQMPLSVEGLMPAAFALLVWFLPLPATRCCRAMMFMPLMPARMPPALRLVMPSHAFTATMRCHDRACFILRHYRHLAIDIMVYFIAACFHERCFSDIHLLMITLYYAFFFYAFIFTPFSLHYWCHFQ